jgi:ATP-dependent Clp protease ATP-binding subunit ClpA
MLKDTKPWHETIMLAREEAVDAGSRTVESEHILLALSSQRGTAARDILAKAGLDHDALEKAFEDEYELSLGEAGVKLEGPAAITRRFVKGPEPRFGQSAKLALQRAAVLGSRRIAPPLEPLHLLVGVLSAKAGTVPRALETAGVNTQELLDKAESALSNPRRNA